MTVITVLYADTTPIVLTDTLISSSTWNGLSLNTPLKPDEARPGIDGFGPVGLAKKAVEQAAGSLCFMQALSKMHSASLKSSDSKPRTLLIPMRSTTASWILSEATALTSA